MDIQETGQFLLKLATEVKQSFEYPVILLTRKDYADNVFNSLVDLRSGIIQNVGAVQMLEIVNTFHIAWLQAVQDIDNFKRRAKITPRESILKAIDYTMGCVKKRYKYFKKYINNVDLSGPEKKVVVSEKKIIKDMQETVISALVEKHKHLKYLADKDDFNVVVSNEIEELLIWLDRLNDSLAIQFSKVIKLKEPLLPADLTKTLQQIIDEIASFNTPEALKIAKELSKKGCRLGAMARIAGSVEDLQISKVIDKIKQLDDRIARLKNEKSSAGLMALQHKSMFLEDRLESLENLRLSINYLKNQKQPDACSVPQNDNIHIFNHMLPHNERCRLVENLVKLWQTAIGDSDSKSIISILSAAAVKEIFTDDLGNFFIDKYSRKIYKIKDDDNMYQVNECNEVVPLSDSDQYVYFYDECGRYYLNEKRARVYKAHDGSCEYMLHRFGMMLKVSEIVDGIEYRYDHLGRYYVNENGVRVYRDIDSEQEYYTDGLGNLEKIRHVKENYRVCPTEPIVTEESLYLKKIVGVALKICLADVVLTLPDDPIKYLADRLEKYHYAIQQKQRRLKLQEKMTTDRERIKAQEPTTTPGQVPSIENYDYELDYEGEMF